MDEIGNKREVLKWVEWQVNQVGLEIGGTGPSGRELFDGLDEFSSQIERNLSSIIKQAQTHGSIN